MSYAFAPGLQAGVYQRLVGDAALGAAGRRRDLRRAAGAWADGRPAADYVTLGEERVRANGTKTSDGRDPRLHGDGAFRARRVRRGEADRGGGLRCLVDAPLALEAGRLVALRFLRAGAERGPAPEKRRVTLRFRAVVDQDD